MTAILAAFDRALAWRHSEQPRLTSAEVDALSTSGAEYLEIFDESHSEDEDRFIAVGVIERGVIVIVWTEQPTDTIRIISARPATPRESESFRRRLENPS